MEHRLLPPPTSQSCQSKKSDRRKLKLLMACVTALKRTMCCLRTQTTSINWESYTRCHWVVLRTLGPARTARRSTPLPTDRQQRTGIASPEPLPSVHRLPSETGNGNTRWRARRGSRHVQPASWRTRCWPAVYASVAYLPTYDSTMHNVLSKTTSSNFSLP